MWTEEEVKAYAEAEEFRLHNEDDYAEATIESAILSEREKAKPVVEALEKAIDQIKYHIRRTALALGVPEEMMRAAASASTESFRQALKDYTSLK